MTPSTTMPVLQFEVGWTGLFTRHQADGAIPNGHRVFKQRSEPGDGTPTGTEGTVLGSMKTPDHLLHHPSVNGERYAYFIEWDTTPKMAVGTVESKVGRIEDKKNTHGP